VFFQTNYDEIELTKSAITSFQWRHRYYVTEKRHQTYVTKFFHFGPLPIKIFGYAIVTGREMYNSVEVIFWCG